MAHVVWLKEDLIKTCQRDLKFTHNTSVLLEFMWNHLTKGTLSKPQENIHTVTLYVVKRTSRKYVKGTFN